jgi:hypothetical protein
MQPLTWYILSMLSGLNMPATVSCPVQGLSQLSQSLLRRQTTLIPAAIGEVL